MIWLDGSRGGSSVTAAITASSMGVRGAQELKRWKVLFVTVDQDFVVSYRWGRSRRWQNRDRHSFILGDESPQPVQ